MNISRCYRFAGVDIQLIIPEDRFCEDEGNLTQFLAEPVSDPHVFRYSFVEELLPPDGVKVSDEINTAVYMTAGQSVRYLHSPDKKLPHGYARISHDGKQHHVQLLSGYITGRVNFYTLLKTLCLEHLVARENGFLFHSSYIDWNGQAILFTAPSGTGKSTQADLWHQYRGTQILNGDRSVIRSENGKIMVAGIPLAGSSQYCQNKSLPLAAVVYLEQAPETTIRKVRGFEAIRRLWEGASVNTWDQEDMRRVSSVIMETAESVPVFHLACTPDLSAVLALEKAMRK